MTTNKIKEIINNEQASADLDQADRDFLVADKKAVVNFYSKSEINKNRRAQGLPEIE